MIGPKTKIFVSTYAKIWQDPFLNCSDSSIILWALEIYPNLHWITPQFRKNSNPSISEYPDSNIISVLSFSQIDIYILLIYHKMHFIISKNMKYYFKKS